MIELYLNCDYLTHTEFLARIGMSSGTMRADATRLSGGRVDHFELDAHIPRPPWHMATEERLASWGIGLGKGNSENTIALVATPETILETIRSRYYSSDRLCEHLIDGEDSEWVKQAVRSALEFSSWEAMNFVGKGAILRVGQGRQRNTTICHTTRKHVGLHLDMFTPTMEVASEMMQNRISFNIGISSRYLQFLPFRATSCMGRAKQGLASAFMEANPEVPAVRLEVRPGEAYIAPTENVIHDGAIYESAADVTLSIRGKFELH